MNARLSAGFAIAGLALIVPGPGLLSGRALSPCGLLIPGAADGNPARTSLQWDVALLQHPWLIHEARELRAGRLPRWNPYALCGVPLIGNPQAAVLSPFTLVAAACPLPLGIAVAAWCKLVVAGLGMFAWLGLFGISAWPALAGAVPFMLGGFMQATLLWPHSGVFCWLPWMLAAVEWLRRASGPAPAGALAVATGLQFLGGHPASSVHALAITAVWAFWRMPAGHRGRYLGLGAGAAVGGALLAAPVLLPFAEYLGRSVVWEARSGGLDRFLSAREAVAWFLPEYHGSPVRLPVWHAAGANPFDAAASPGMVAWVLAAAAFTGGNPRRAVLARGLAGLGVLGAVTALNVPGLHVALVSLPLFSALDNVRAGSVTGFAVCALAAVTAARLWDGGAGRVDAIRAVRRAAAIAVALIAALVAIDARAIGATPGAWRVAGTAAGLGAGLAILAGWAAGRGRGVPWLLILLAPADLLGFGLRWNATMPAALFYPVTPVVAALRLHPHDRVMLLPVRVGTAYGLREPGGMDAITPRVIRDALGDARTGGPAGTGALVIAHEPRSAALRNAAVRRYATNGRAAIREDPGALARARLDDGTPAAFAEDDPERVVLAVAPARATTLVLADTFDPGWRATVNGARVVIRPYMTAFREVAVPAGRSTVEFDYDPLSFRLGLLLAGLALGAIMASGAMARRV